MITQADIENGLRKVGLRGGDIVLLHSSVVSLGDFSGDADSIIDAFLAVIGNSGTLLAPCFGKLGIIPELLKKRSGAIVSPCPVGTVVALGPAAEELCRDHWKPESPHAEATPYARLAEMGGYICLFGVDQDRNTFLHGIEARLKLSYLGEVSETFTTPSGEQLTKTWRYYPGPHRDFIGLDHQLKDAGILQKTRIGDAEVRLMTAADVLDFGLKLGSSHPDFVLCSNPECADCVSQRAALFSDAMTKESFKLSVSAQLAGKYVDEMIDNLTRSGIHAIELDNLNGRPFAMLSMEMLADATNRLRQKNIAISAIRLPTLPDGPRELMQKISACGIFRVICPIATPEDVESIVSAAREFDIDICVANYKSTALNSSKKYDACAFNKPSFCFNPAEFAAVGENPFLNSYRVGRFIRKTIQLDITDGKWDGTPALPGFGNGEVKELLSIFRCRNFSGYLVLGGGMRGGCGLSFSDFVAAFKDLLERM